MKVNIEVPGVGESITEGLLASWTVPDLSMVGEGDPVFELETDKTTLDVSSPATGQLHITVSEGTDVKIGEVVGFIDTEAKSEDKAPPAPEEPAVETSSTPGRATPAAKATASAAGLDISTVTGTGRNGMVTKSDLIPQKGSGSGKSDVPESEHEGLAEYRKPLSRIRKAIAANLKSTQNELVLLTTFNEVDMSAAKALRKNYGEAFLAKHGVKLGFMSIFLKASAAALAAYPEINAVIDGNDVVYREKINISVAVSTPRGLVTPVIRDLASKSFADIESGILEYAAMAANKTLLPEHLMGGTFTVTNGGVFGSLLSTPLPAPGQSAILGMHGIKDRPVAIDGEVVIRPMMYIALSYDHRLVDGREAVRFLKSIKDAVEHPERLMLDI